MSWSLSAVVPTYCGGVSLWFGIGDLVRWRHPAVNRLRVIIVDDGSPRCAFHDGTVDIDGVELVFLVNQVNRGQSQASWRGFVASTRASDTEWTVFLEDDLLCWREALEVFIRHLATGAADTDVVNIARPHLISPRQLPFLTRRVVQPLVRLVFRCATGIDMIDPTSPIKGVRTRAFDQAIMQPWRFFIHEGFLIESRSSSEVAGHRLGWTGAVSRYSAFASVRLAVRLGLRVLAYAACGRRKRTIRDASA